MKTSSAKNKGRTLQKLLVKSILQKFPTLSEHDVRSTSMGATGVDVLLSSASLKLFPFSVECKNLARIAVYSLYEQAVANKLDGTKALLVIKQNRSNPLVVLSLEDFMEIYESR